MITRNAEAEWTGNLKEGKGTVKLGSGSYNGQYGFKSRFESGPGTNPEELIAAAHAGCYSMALSNELSNAGHIPKRVHTVAKVNLDMKSNGPVVSGIELTTVAEIPGIDEATFQKLVEGAKTNCPISKALSATPIHLKATLVKS